MRKSLLDYANELDEATNTPSDYTLMGTGMKFNNYSPKGIED